MSRLTLKICEVILAYLRLFPHCKTCKLRSCVRQRELGSCAHCSDYGCETMQEFLREISGCHEYLEGERSRLSG